MIILQQTTYFVAISSSFTTMFETDIVVKGEIADSVVVKKGNCVFSTNQSFFLSDIVLYSSVSACFVILDIIVFVCFLWQRKLNNVPNLNIEDSVCIASIEYNVWNRRDNIVVKGEIATTMRENGSWWILSPLTFPSYNNSATDNLFCCNFFLYHNVWNRHCGKRRNYRQRCSKKKWNCVFSTNHSFFLSDIVLYSSVSACFVILAIIVFVCF